MWTSLHANVFCCATAGLFVGSLYLLPANVRALPRDHPKHVLYRLVAAFLYTLLLVLTLSLIISPYFEWRQSPWRLMGMCINRMTLRAVAVTACLMAVFYLGPLLTYVATLPSRLRGPAAPSLSTAISSDLIELFDRNERVICVRNLLAAPLLEEVVFRGVALASLCGVQRRSPPSIHALALLAPFYFGAAHLHHLYEKVRSGLPLPSVLSSTLLQFSYTYLFGYIACLLLLRTAQLSSSITSHMICNAVGLPNLSFLSPSHPLHPYRLPLLFAHLLGLLLFAYFLFPCTESFSRYSPYTFES